MKVSSRKVSFLILFLIYMFAFVSSCIIFNVQKSDSLLFKTMVSTVFATVIVWLSGIVFGNASVYDPYWSVQPMVIAAFWYLKRGTALSLMDISILSAVFFWGIRLTVNWAITFKGLSFQDWRYTKIRNDHRSIWFLSNLMGINMMPTLLVFTGTIPLYHMIFNHTEFTLLFLSGLLICLVAPVIQFIADRQLRTFRKVNRSGYIFSGLWKYSRHPNYLGEMAFWWGIFLMMMGSAGKPFTAVAGPVLISALFLFISIPMMEKHMTEKNPDYVNYQKEVSLLTLHIFKKT